MPGEGNATVVKSQSGSAVLREDFVVAAVAMACLAGSQKATVNQMSLTMNDLRVAEIGSVEVPEVKLGGQQGYYCEKLDSFIKNSEFIVFDEKEKQWSITEDGRDACAEVIAAAFAANPEAVMKAADEICLDWELVVARGIRVIKARHDKAFGKNQALADEKR
jgi:hypothetical protein